MAWAEGKPERADRPLRVEAAAYRGRPVYFELVGPWSRPPRVLPGESRTRSNAFEIFLASLFTVLLVGGALLARRNLLLGRGDRRGAMRVAAFIFLCFMLSWALEASHVGNISEYPLFIQGLGTSLFVAGLSWLIAQRLRMQAPVRQVETWSCGYPLITPRMQYTASSFAALLVGMFGRVSGVRKHQGASVFHSEPIDLVLDAAVVPSWAFVERAALRLRPLQQGRLRRYLLYVIGTVVALLAYLLFQAGGR